jgi:hypothetical protein
MRAPVDSLGFCTQWRPFLFCVCRINAGLDSCSTLIWREDGDTHGELREQPIH